MNHQSRTYNSVKNATISIAMQIMTLLTSFIGRTVFIKVLGDQYLGISGLYTNLLSVLSLADLGITTVMTFSLYKPIAQNDVETVKTLMEYFKRLYRYIALAIFVLGMILVPFLNYVINGSELPLHELKLYYILFLINIVCSYLVVYKTTLITADQRVYIIKVADFVARVLAEAVMIVVLLLTGNYLAYLIGNVIVTIAKNISLSCVADRLYPFLKDKKWAPVSPDVKKNLSDNIKSLFIYRVSAMIMNSTDNILISIILGTLIVGYYSNYLIIVTALNTFILLLAQSLLSSIGNFNEVSDTKRKLLLFRSLLLVFFLIGAVCVSCFQTMFNDFIYLWIGKENPEYMLSGFDVACISINFFVSCILNPIWMYREATGIFKKTRYSMTCAAAINIILSIVLGRVWGLGGIIVATGISKLLTNFWYEPIVLYKEIFCSKLREYWFDIGKLLAISAFCVIGSIWICFRLPCGWGWMFLKIFVSTAICCVTFCLAFYRTEEFRLYTNLLRGFLNRKTSIADDKR